MFFPPSTCKLYHFKETEQRFISLHPIRYNLTMKSNYFLEKHSFKSPYLRTPQTDSGFCGAVRQGAWDRAILPTSTIVLFIARPVKGRGWLMPLCAVGTRTFEWADRHPVNPCTIPESFSFPSQFPLPVTQVQSSWSGTGINSVDAEV